MKNRVLILINKRNLDFAGINWSAIGTVVTELSELYQIIKERRIDVLLVDASRHDLKRPVATKVRRYNGLTEIWLVTREGRDHDQLENYVDGAIPLGVGAEGIAAKVSGILHGRELLAEYGMIGRSLRVKAVAETIERVAPTEVPILIVGPSGAGKELVARAVHKNSRRHDKPYVDINCGALAEGVLESELFGHEKGAFTGSVSKREGLFYKAEGGTIFLDEIGETTSNMQVKLLRVLEDGTYYPVGSSTARKANVRVVSATNRDLTEAIAERAFREDLYFRIGVVKIVVPPLLDRRGDIQPLLQHFWRSYPGLEYTDAALDLLMKYDWPGNVRQLKNFADRMVALKPEGLVEQSDVERFIDEQHSTLKHLPVSTGRTVEEAGQELIYRAILQLGNEIRLLRDLITSHLPAESTEEEYETSSVAAGTGQTMEALEKEAIKRTLDDTGGNRKEAARRLGIGERTLYRKLKRYNLR